MDFSGVRVEIGLGVANFAVGDEVFGTTGTAGFTRNFISYASGFYFIFRLAPDISDFLSRICMSLEPFAWF